MYISMMIQCIYLWKEVRGCGWWSATWNKNWKLSEHNYTIYYLRQTIYRLIYLFICGQQSLVTLNINKKNLDPDHAQIHRCFFFRVRLHSRCLLHLTLLLPLHARQFFALLVRQHRVRGRGGVSRFGSLGCRRATTTLVPECNIGSA